MKKFLNNPQDIRQEVLEGLALSNPNLITLTKQGLVVNNKLPDAERVTLVSLGGIGHEPGLSGFVGEGMLDISVPGNVFAAPSPALCLDALQLASKGHGSLLIVLNHTSDVLTAKMTLSKASELGLNVAQLIIHDDISMAPRTHMDSRRGLFGCIAVYKIAGAAAARGYSLEDVVAIGERFSNNMGTIGVAVNGASNPVTGELICYIREDQMEVGMGQHGEDSGYNLPMMNANDTAAYLVQALIADLSLTKGDRVLLLINGLGSTTLMEKLIVFRAAYKYLERKGIFVAKGMVDDFLTTQEAGGFQILLAKMDDELLSLWNAPCKTPYLTKG